MKKMRHFGRLLLLLVLCSITRGNLIRIREGPIEGKTVTVENQQVFAYLGIPYAKPPIGTRRFKPPEPHEGWESVRLMNQFGSPCPQPFQQDVYMSEDCLTLNVWTPTTGRYRRFPVVVLLEGELFLTSLPSRFPGQDIAVVDMVVVTVNYRVNAFGFLSWQDDYLPGNLGLMDQALALRWISTNIELFGGDANSVTLLGHSAGAASVAFHMAAEQSRVLFQRAIILSGSSLSPWAINQQPRTAARTLARDLRCPFNATYPSASYNILRCLQNGISMREIINVVEKMIKSGNPYNLFAPVLDGHFSPESRLVGEDGPRRRLEMVAPNFPVLVGVAELDGSVILFAKSEINVMSFSYLRRYGREILVPLVNMMAGHSGSALPLLNYMVDYTYLEKAKVRDKGDLVRMTVQMFTDSFFASPIMEMAEIFARRGLNVYLLVNDFPSPNIYTSLLNLTGALHGSEMSLLFGPTSYNLIFRRPLTYEEGRRSRALKQMLRTFGVRGEPDLPTIYSRPPRWERYTVQSPIYATLSTGQMRRGYRSHELSFWNVLLPDVERIVERLLTGRPFPTTTSDWRDTTFRPTEDPTSEPNTSDFATYQSAVWVLVAVVLLMVLSVVVFIICARRRQRLNSATLHVP